MKEKKSETIRHFALNTGANIPAVGLGTWQADGDSCRTAVRIALEVGYRHFDCAHLYGNEVEVGQALTEAFAGGVPGLTREDVFVTSKLWCTTNAPKRVEATVQMSLKNLGLSYLDLYLVHWPEASSIGDATDPPHKLEKPCLPIERTWRAMEHLIEKGFVRAIGVSNFSIAEIEELLTISRIRPAVNQIELHPLWRQDVLVKFCQREGIHVSAHTPLGVPGSSIANFHEDGFIGEHGIVTPPIPIALLRSRSVHSPMLKTSVVASIAKRLHKTPAQVILRWGLQRGTSVLPRSLNADRICSNFDILNWSLADEDWNAINCLEPQLPLTNSHFSFLSANEQLQAVEEQEGNELTE